MQIRPVHFLSSLVRAVAPGRELEKVLPIFDTNGHLPPGIHSASAEELEERFGIFVISDRRPRLFAKLKELMALCRASGIIETLLLAGSFVTTKPDPNDIDVILVLSSDVDFNDLTAIQATVSDRDALRRVFRGTDLDVLVVREGTGRLQTAIEFFQTNRDNVPVGIVEVDFNADS